MDVVVKGTSIWRIDHGKKNELIDKLRERKHSGLVLFFTGTTGRPKAILHDLTKFMKKFETPRPTLRTINFFYYSTILEVLIRCYIHCSIKVQ